MTFLSLKNSVRVTPSGHTVASIWIGRGGRKARSVNEKSAKGDGKKQSERGRVSPPSPFPSPLALPLTKRRLETSEVRAPGEEPMFVICFISQWMKRTKHGLFVFPPKKTLIWRRHCSIGQSCCSMTLKRSIG